jgi:hypothetical protein
VTVQDLTTAAAAVVAAAKPDRADHGRTVLVPRELIDALVAALKAARAAEGRP